MYQLTQGGTPIGHPMLETLAFGCNTIKKFGAKFQNINPPLESNKAMTINNSISSNW
jgi:hypothetical protein